MIPSCPDLSRIVFGIGWVGWKNFVCQLLLLAVEQLSLLDVEQFSSPILESNRDVARSLVVVEVTRMISHIRLLQFSV